MDTDVIITQPPAQAPRQGNRLTRALGKGLLRLLGWRIVGHMPNHPKMIICAAPHTSNWDFVLAMLAVLALNLRVAYLMKKEAFVWPLAGLFKRLGGVPIERSHTEGLINSFVNWLNQQDEAWLLITPEGTRKKVPQYKTGFLRVSEAANVPIVLASWDYPTKRIVIEKEWRHTGNHDADCQAIRQYLNERYTGRHPQWQ